MPGHRIVMQTVTASFGEIDGRAQSIVGRACDWNDDADGIIQEPHPGGRLVGMTTGLPGPAIPSPRSKLRGSRRALPLQPSSCSRWMAHWFDSRT